MFLKPLKDFFFFKNVLPGSFPWSNKFHMFITVLSISISFKFKITSLDFKGVLPISGIF